MKLKTILTLSSLLLLMVIGCKKQSVTPVVSHKFSFDDENQYGVTAIKNINETGHTGMFLYADSANYINQTK